MSVSDFGNIVGLAVGVIITIVGVYMLWRSYNG